MPIDNGIRHLPPDQANWLRARVAWDSSFYWRLARRIGAVNPFARDDATQDLLNRCNRAWLALSALRDATTHAGVGRRRDARRDRGDHR